MITKNEIKKCANYSQHFQKVAKPLECFKLNPEVACRAVSWNHVEKLLPRGFGAKTGYEIGKTLNRQECK